MGTYCYILTTQTRKVEVDGRTVAMNLLKYSHKEFSWRSDEPAWLKAKLAKMDNVWGDSNPDYIVAAVNDKFEDGAEVFTNWGGRGGSMTDHSFGNLDFVGILRAKGKRFVLDKWTVIEVESDKPQTIYEALRGLTKGKVRVEYKDKKSQPPVGYRDDGKRYVFRIVCEHENDAVMAKVALY